MKAVFKHIQNRDIIILKIFNQKIKCKALDVIMPILTYLGSFLFVTLFCLVAFLAKNEVVHKFSIRCIITLSFSASLTQLVKVSVNRLRPYITIENLYIKKIGIDRYSFPSGHTAVAFSLAIMTSLFFPKLVVLSILLGTCVGISRMYLGVHYPTDVIFGMIIGTISSFLVYNFI